MGSIISTPNNMSGVMILNKFECHNELINAESVDKYLELCSKSWANSSARSSNNYNAYTLTDVEINAYFKLFNEYLRYLPPRLLSDINFIKICILMPSADNGFPHTRPGNLICFPHASILPPLKTFKHELWHVHQRLYPLKWRKIYIDVWGFSPYRLSDIPEQYRKQVRLNPDTIMFGFFCWRNEWMPLPIMTSPTHPKLNECEIWFYNVRTGTIRHSMPDAWSTYFHSTLLPASAHEHPNELSAYMLSELHKDDKSQAFKDLLSAVGITSML
jgi:hypothetical protein